jgi:hypothetical protein
VYGQKIGGNSGNNGNVYVEPLIYKGFKIKNVCHFEKA